MTHYRLVIAALTILTVTSATAPNAEAWNTRRAPVLDYDSRLIIGTETYTPSNNAHRDGRPHGVAPAAQSDKKTAPAEIERKPAPAPGIAQCVAGCG